MKRTQPHGVALVAALSGILLIGCSSNNASTTTPTTPATQQSSPSASAEPLHLVFISDSSGDRVAPLYADHISKAMGRDVQVTDWSIGNLTTVGALETIKRDPNDVAEADIIVVGGSPGDSGTPVSICFDSEGAAPRAFAVEDWKGLRAQLDAIYAEIWRLRNGAPTILRTMDYYQPFLSDWRAAGIEEECIAEHEAWSAAIQQSAQANGATMVSIFDVFNGLEHREDPRAKGYVSSDGMHTSPEGAAIIADTLASAGYATSTM